jgi:hypothetical protein
LLLHYLKELVHWVLNRYLGYTGLIPSGLCCKEMTVVDLIPGGLGPAGA